MLTIALVAELAGYASQSAWLNHLRKNYLHLFPRLCDRTRYGRRIRRLRPAMESLRRHLIFLMNVDLSQLRVLDSFPLSICHMRRVNSSSQPFEYFATVVYCAAKKEYFYGFRVHLITDLRGVAVGYLLTSDHVHASRGLVFLLEEESQLEEFIEKVIQILGDKGYVGEENARRLKEKFGVEILAMRKQYKKDEPVSVYNEIVGKARKIIETTIDELARPPRPNYKLGHRSGRGYAVHIAFIKRADREDECKLDLCQEHRRIADKSGGESDGLQSGQLPQPVDGRACFAGFIFYQLVLFTNSTSRSHVQGELFRQGRAHLLFFLRRV